MLALCLSLTLLPSLSFAYSFNFTDTPRQCDNISISVTGSGSPPYRVLIIPFGPSPLPNNTEARRITEQNFTGSDTSVSFQLKFPENSQFVAVVSDSTGFGTGGTSGAVTVLSGSNSSCFDATKNVAPLFDFSIVPGGVITQCSATRFWWDPSQVSGTPSFQGVIPGGQSIAVPESSLTTVPSQGLGFSWTPSVRAGTTLLLLGGDDRGLGTAGSAVYIVGSGDNSCLSDSSPSSTPGSPAGGSYPTSTSETSSGGSSGGHHTNVGAIVGGVIGGVFGALALVLIALFFLRRQRFQQSTKERPVDLLREEGDEQEQEQDMNNNHLPPRYYEPEPFVLPDPSATSTVDGTDVDPSVAGVIRPSTDRRYSRYSLATTETGGLLRASTPDYQSGSASGSASQSGTTYMRKSPAPPSFRPVNIVQHEDAGPGTGEPETIELPPAYTNIKRAGAGATSTETGTEAGTGTGTGSEVAEGSSDAPTSTATAAAGSSTAGPTTTGTGST